MIDHNFQITNADTDSISFCKHDMTPFTKDEINNLMDEINKISPEFMIWENDGYFSKFLVLKSKNYVMIDESGKRKIKGSSLKSSTLEPKIKQMIQDMLDMLLEDRQKDMKAIYNSYIKLVRDGITDIKPWAKKLTLSPTTFESTRLNETKIINAIKDTQYKSGDRIYVYSKSDGTLKLTEQYDGDYDKKIYYEKLYKATARFETVLPVKEMFLNYALKRNIKLVDEL
jgi:hypothetical protein